MSTSHISRPIRPLSEPDMLDYDADELRVMAAKGIGPFTAEEIRNEISRRFINQFRTEAK